MSELGRVISPLREHRRSLLPLAATLLFTYAYFVPAAAWNQNSRLALTRALVEHRSTIIDEYHVTTGDKSFRDGHFYSDKAPGISWLSTIPYALFHGWRTATGGEKPGVGVQPLDPRAAAAGEEPLPEERKPGDVLVYNQAHRLALYLCTLFSVGLPSLLGAVALYLLALRSSGRHLRACLVTGMWSLGTPALVYSTSLYGHQTCAALLLGAFALVCLTEHGTALVGVATGALLGLAVTVEYPAAVAVVLLVTLAWHRHGLRFAAFTIAGGLPFAVALAVYHTAAFGHPLATGYDFVYREEFATGMAVRYGIGAPDLQAALAITFGSYRGLFYLSPVLLLAIWGLPRGFLDRLEPGRFAWAIALIVFAYFLLLNAGYYMWDGGAAAGPRHLVPALPFLALGLLAVVDRVPRLMAVLGIVSVGQMLLLAAAAPEASQYGNPLWQYAVDALLAREPGPQVTATNLGALMGLPGPASLLPLLVPWWWSSSALRSDRARSAP